MHSGIRRGRCLLWIAYVLALKTQTPQQHKITLDKTLKSLKDILLMNLESGLEKPILYQWLQTQRSLADLERSYHSQSLKYTVSGREESGWIRYAMPGAGHHETAGDYQSAATMHIVCAIYYLQTYKKMKPEHTEAIHLCIQQIVKVNLTEITDIKSAIAFVSRLADRLALIIPISPKKILNSLNKLKDSIFSSHIEATISVDSIINKSGQECTAVRIAEPTYTPISMLQQKQLTLLHEKIHEGLYEQIPSPYFADITKEDPILAQAIALTLCDAHTSTLSSQMLGSPLLRNAQNMTLGLVNAEGDATIIGHYQTYGAPEGPYAELQLHQLFPYTEEATHRIAITMIGELDSFADSLITDKKEKKAVSAFTEFKTAKSIHTQACAAHIIHLPTKAMHKTGFWGMRESDLYQKTLPSIDFDPDFLKYFKEAIITKLNALNPGHLEPALKWCYRTAVERNLDSTKCTSLEERYRYAQQIISYINFLGAPWSIAFGCMSGKDRTGILICKADAALFEKAGIILPEGSSQSHAMTLAGGPNGGNIYGCADIALGTNVKKLSKGFSYTHEHADSPRSTGTESGSGSGPGSSFVFGCPTNSRAENLAPTP